MLLNLEPKRKLRIIDQLRRDFPGKWTYDHKRFHPWQSETHTAKHWSCIHDAEMGIYGVYLQVETIEGKYVTRMNYRTFSE